MGDLRNKFAKIERDEAHRAWLRKTYPAKPIPSSLYPKCQCGLTVFEARVYQCGKDGYFCLVCMPLKWKLELMGHMTNVGMNYDASEHGEK